MFKNLLQVQTASWQSFERNLCRLLIYEDYKNVRLVGQSNDHGADVTASKFGKKWVFQVKHWNKPVGMDVVEEIRKAVIEYSAQIPVIVSSAGFDSSLKEYQRLLLSQHIPLQLWDTNTLVSRSQKLPNVITNSHLPRPYQENAIDEVCRAFYEPGNKKILVVMATGLGKTFVAAESIRRIRKNTPCRILVCAHTNDLVYQLEKSFWPFLYPSDETILWNFYERPTEKQLCDSPFVFACVDSVSNYIDRHGEIPFFDILLVDECHHVGSSMYDKVFEALRAGKNNGAFAFGLTATPWRPDDADLSVYFGTPRVSIDMVMGLKKGFLTNVDYRMYTDNINWDSLKNLEGTKLTPKQINRTLFINQWDDAVVYTLRDAWKEQKSPRAIVFCGTIEHAIMMKTKINALSFCKAEAIYSDGAGQYGNMTQYQRNRILSDFAEGCVNIICAVDIFNEGIDVPDVNILVFQRVTHSRRIFIQQLGRGLRISEDKDKVIVLDFVSDIRRFAAGLSLKDALNTKTYKTIRIDLPNTVKFVKVGGEDPETEKFLRQWLDDVVAIEDAGEDTSILKFPPLLLGGKNDL